MRVRAVMLVLALAGGGALTSAHGAHLSEAAAEPSPYVRGVGLGLFATDPHWDYAPLVEEIRARGATDVLLVVNGYQSNRFTSDIALWPGRSPSLATVRRTLRQVRAAGMRVALMPVVRLRERAPHEWRGVISPADGVEAWFRSYRKLVMPLARLAAAEGAARFVVGSELSSLEAYQAQWRQLIAEVRELFGGTLTYSANWDHAGDVLFWDAVDEIGLTAYFPLGVEGESSMASAWRVPRAKMEALGAGFGKPVLITEVGYPSRRGAALRPWDDAQQAAVDLEGQRELYRAFCDAFSETPSVSGFYVWNWFGVGGPRDRGFTPRGKPAAVELARCFERAWPAPSVMGNEG